MSMNKFMHPRNIYRSPPNFIALSLQYPEFDKYITRKPNGKAIFDFKNPDALRCLTLILLKKDFDLELTIPEKKLIPTLPLRLNYILWIEDMLNWSDEDKFSVRGFDIGTGATCIYPLLAAKKNGWEMTATDIDVSSVKTAKENIKKNSLDNLISVVAVSKSTFLDGVVKENEKFDFCMCNPPFFNSDAESYQKTNDTDHINAYGASDVGSIDEIQSVGGEVNFVKNIIQDSLKLQDQIRIYTTMVGHKSSVVPLLEELKKNNIKSVSQTEFCQGRTVRWAIAWSLIEDTLKHFSPLSQTNKLPKPLTWLFESKFPFKECAELVIPQLLSQLKIESRLLEDFKKRRLWRIFSVEETWTNLRKKRREQSRHEEKLTEPIKPACEAIRSVTVDQSAAEVAELSPNKSDPMSSKESDNVFFQVNAKIKESCPKNDYCRLYAVNEKRKFSSEDADVPLKKLKTDDPNSSPTTAPNYVLQALLSVKNMNNKIELQILYEHGKKDAPQQILQFLKNNLAK